MAQQTRLLPDTADISAVEHSRQCLLWVTADDLDVSANDMPKLSIEEMDIICQD